MRVVRPERRWVEQKVMGGERYRSDRVACGAMEGGWSEVPSARDGKRCRG